MSFRMDDSESQHSDFVKLLIWDLYEGWNYNSGNYLFTTDTK